VPLPMPLPPLLWKDFLVPCARRLADPSEDKHNPPLVVRAGGASRLHLQRRGADGRMDFRLCHIINVRDSIGDKRWIVYAVGGWRYDVGVKTLSKPMTLSSNPDTHLQGVW
jgi:hypothetical protein